MKMNRLFYILPLFLVAFSTSCDRREMGYTFETCSAFFKDSHMITGEQKYTDTHWAITEQNSVASYAWMRYSGDAFEDVCVKEANGMKANIVGKFLDVKAYMKITENDSFPINLAAPVQNGTDMLWSGSTSSISLVPYYQHYPGRMYPVVYVKIPYFYLVPDIKHSYVELKKVFTSFTFQPTGKSY